MSSGTKYEPQAGRKVSSAMASKVMAKIERLGLSPRQQELNHLYSYYRCVQYDARRCDWDGKERVDPIEHEAIATAGYIPGGFYDAGQSLPLKFRRPTAPYHLPKVIVDRFTGLLFSEKRHPTIRAQDDEKTEDFVNALAEEARLWPMMIRARTLGGAMGTVCVGFQFVDGKPVVEIHDPRWMIPDFEDRWSLKLRSVEKRYQYPQEEKDPETKRWVTVWYWYRRVIDDVRDVVYEPVQVDDGEEPVWVEKISVTHGLGFCPVVWTQNLPVEEDIDGDPDCHGVFDTCEAIDALLAQSNRGTVANCDPTLVIVSEAPLAEVRKGSDNAIKLPTNSSAEYLELQGAAAKAALEMVDKLRAYALEVAQCILEHPEVANRTATEVSRAFESMYSKADVLREQYGQNCVLKLLNMMIAAARSKNKPKVEQGTVVRDVVVLPPRRDGEDLVPRELGEGGTLQLLWPPYAEPTHTDALGATQAAVAAVAGRILDREHGANYVASFFNVEDVPAMLASIEKERTAEVDQMAAIAGNDPDADGDVDLDADGKPITDPDQNPDADDDVDPSTPTPAAPDTASDVQLTATDIGAIITVNEGRSKMGFGPLLLPSGANDPDGFISIAEFKAKHAQVVAESARVTTGDDSGEAPKKGLPPALAAAAAAAGGGKAPPFGKKKDKTEPEDDEGDDTE